MGEPEPANEIVCPECGDVRVRTPEGTTALPTIGTARKLAGVTGCDCGRDAGHGGDGGE